MATAQREVKAGYPEKLKILFQPGRYKVLYGGRGSGKSWGIARALLQLGTMKPIRVLCTREVQRSINDSVHRLLADQIAELDLFDWYTVGHNEIRGANGTLFVFSGLQHQTVANLKSYEGMTHCWVEEAQVISNRSWEVLIPTIRAPESEIWISFNPELDTDPTYQRFIESPPPNTLTAYVNWRDNPWFPQVLDVERRHLERVDPEGYMNIWEGKCRSAVEGAIYASEIRDAIEQRRICPCPVDPLLRVHTVWDLGWNDQTSIIFVQQATSEVRIVDYLEDSHRTLDSYVMEIRDKKYNWGVDFLPHDGEAKNIQTGLAPVDILRKLDRRVQVIPRESVETGIKAARLMFRRVYFDDAKTERLVQCLRRYRRQINQSTNEPTAPLHDEFSHGADAFRGLALVQERLRANDYKPIQYPSMGGSIV